MSIMACWLANQGESNERLFLVADSRFSESRAKQKLLDIGQKVFALQFHLRLPFPFKPKDTICMTQLGLGLIGNVLLAHAFANISNTFLSNLYAFGADRESPTLSELSNKLALLLQRVTQSTKFAKSPTGFVQACLVGRCLVEGTLQAFSFWLDPASDYAAVIRRVEFISDTHKHISKVELFGDALPLFSKTIDEYIAFSERDTSTAQLDITAPIEAIKKVIDSGEVKTVGGILHGGIVSEGGFELRSFWEKKYTRKNIFLTPNEFSVLEGDPSFFQINGLEFWINPFEL